MTAPWVRAALAPERRCVLLLLLALCVAFASVAGRSHSLGSMNTSMSLGRLTHVENLSPVHGFVVFDGRYLNSEGEHAYALYNRYPIGGLTIIKAVTLPFQGDVQAKRQAARALMLAFFASAMLAAYFALKRLTSSPPIALTATLLGFSSYYALGLADVIGTEGVMDLFMVLLTFHGLVVFVQEGRFGQLLGKACAALLVGWHVFALLLPFIVLGLAAEWLHREDSVLRRAGRLLRSRHVALGAVALTAGVSTLALNFGLEAAASTGEPLTERGTPLDAAVSRPASMSPRSSYSSALSKVGWDPGYNARRSINLRTTMQRLFGYAGRACVPYGVEALVRSVLNLRRNQEYRAQPPGNAQTAAEVLSTPNRADHREEARSLAATATRLCGLLAFVAATVGIAAARRHRILLATLTLPGFCWGLLVLGHYGPYEGMFFVGLPMAVCAVALTHARRWPWSARATNGCVAIALAVFSLSALQVSDLGLGKAPRPVDAFLELAADKQAIHGVAPERSVVIVGSRAPCVGPSGEHDASRPRRARVRPDINEEEPYLLTGRIFLSAFNHEHWHRADFVLTRCIVGDEGLLTPDNRHFFLYDRATYDARYAALDESRVDASSDVPASQAEAPPSPSRAGTPSRASGGDAPKARL